MNRAVKKAKDVLLDENLELTHSDKALIAAYILTVTKESSEFASRTVNDFLEGVGLDRVPNITAAITALETQNLFETIEKSGESQQSQKRHRLTAAGYSKASLLLALRDAA